MTQSDTPRSGTPTELPSGPVEIARLVRSLRRDLVLLRDLLATAPPIPLEDEPAPPQSKLTLGSAAKWFLIANGALELAVQVAAIFKPDLVGPLQVLREAIRGAQ